MRTLLGDVHRHKGPAGVQTGLVGAFPRYAPGGEAGRDLGALPVPNPRHLNSPLRFPAPAKVRADEKTMQIHVLQGYLAHKKTPHPSTLQ